VRVIQHRWLTKVALNLLFFFRYVYAAGTKSTAPGATPQSVDNSYTTATGTARASESAVVRIPPSRLLSLELTSLIFPASGTLIPPLALLSPSGSTPTVVRIAASFHLLERCIHMHTQTPPRTFNSGSKARLFTGALILARLSPGIPRPSSAS
jgi:hypothetical protein